MNNSRRNFIKKTATTALGFSIGGIAAGMNAKSYSRIKGANDRLVVAIAGLGRRLDAFYEPISDKNSNVDLKYLCDVMKLQREKAVKNFSSILDGNPVLVNDIRAVIDDKQVDVLINLTPDHWHAPGTWMAVMAGKHVYVEKPCSHNPMEGEILVAIHQKYGKIIQMGNQQRSSVESREIIEEIHRGAIGDPYEAITFYASDREEVPNQQIAPVPDGLDWDLFQGPAPRKPYTYNTWDYNWHWYGWDYGTAEIGNNGVHELDIARWALRVEFPEKVCVDAKKRHFIYDGWTMYDTMLASFYFPGNKVIRWDCKSRNNYTTYGTGRGTIIYGTLGTVFIDRDGYKMYDRYGKLVLQNKSKGNEAGNIMGGGGDLSTMHILNFFDAVRGKVKLNSPIVEGVKSTLLCHLANISYRLGKELQINPQNGHIYDQDAMKLWKREYQPGWEPPRI